MLLVVVLLWYVSVCVCVCEYVRVCACMSLFVCVSCDCMRYVYMPTVVFYFGLFVFNKYGSATNSFTCCLHLMYNMHGACLPLIT
jgi:hypothetical protein